MKKYSNPYTEAHGLKLAMKKDFSYVTIIKNRFYGLFKNSYDWTKIQEVPGTLKISVTDDGTNNNLCSISITCRVAFACEENREFLNLFIGIPLLVRYTSASRQEKAAGSWTYPLYLSISSPSGYDGYELTFTGSGIDIDNFI